jgi:DNA-binding response OmpR family regulator
LSDQDAYRILLVEDEHEVARSVLDALSSRGLSVIHAPSLTVARQILDSQTFDLAILDLNLPDGSGLDLTQPLRAVCRDIPILVLTARSGVADRVRGLSGGADDYVCKPFAPEELTARVEALLRRARSSRTHVLSYADLELDLLTRRMRHAGTEEVLSARETELLAYFLRHPEQALSRERLLEAVWRDEAEDDSNVLNVYVNYLRNKTEKTGGPRLLHTVRGVGYMLSRKEPEELERARGT